MAYNHPVTISWRPRHADIRMSHYNYTDQYGSSAFHNKVISNFAESQKMVRSYLPTDVDPNYTTEYQYWMGPVIRLLDADIAIEDTPSDESDAGVSLYDKYGIRVTTKVRVRFKKMNANDDIFPKFQA